MTNWIKKDLQQSDAATNPDSEPVALNDEANSRLEARAQQCWHQVAQGFAQDVREFQSTNGSAHFEQSSEFRCRIANPAAGISVQVLGDMPQLIIRYDYQSEGQRAGVPEGGILTIRDSGRSVELYSADERLTLEQARKLVLEPVLFPNKSEALEQTGT
jgi:hypothetical protein